jgi:hypothetical protein
MIFRVTAAPEPGVLAAWSEPAGGVGERVWYFPSGDGRSPEVAREAAPVTLKQAVRIGAAQPPGAYRVHLVLARRPLSREQLLSPSAAADVLASRVVPFEVSP